MYISVFSDELYRDIYEVLPIFHGWGMDHVDLRARVNGKKIENQTKEELLELKKTLDGYGMKVGVLQTSLCKVHMPDAARQAKELEQLEGIIRAADILDCRLVRSFNYWQHREGDPALGALATRPDALAECLELFYPVAKRAREAGLILGFENCGQTPEEAIAVIDALNVPGWGMAWDVSNMFEILPEAQGDCVDYFTRALKYANMIHVKCRGVPDIREVEARKVPWERVLAGALTTGKDLPVSIETHAFGELDKEEITHRCYTYLKRVWPSAAPADMKTALSPRETFSRPYKDDPVRFVVVGLGMGKTRCAQLAQTEGVKLCGVCDINPAKAKEVGEQYGVPYSEDLKVFLNDPAVEVVYVVTPTGTHCDIAMQCLRAGKHVLTTKPMDVSAAKCAEAIAVAKEKGLLLGVDFDLHYRGPLSELILAKERGFFGSRILGANCVLNVRRTEKYYKENGGWRGTWALDGGGALSNQAIHEIDRLISVLGVPARVRTTTYRQFFDIEAEDFGVSEWQYDDGCVARLSATTSYFAASWYTRVEVYGDEGAYVLTSGGPEGDHVYWYRDGKWSETAPYPYVREWRQASDNFAYCVRTGAPLAVPAEEGRVTRFVLDKMYESARTGTWTEIPAGAAE